MRKGEIRTKEGKRIQKKKRKGNDKIKNERELKKKM